MKKVNLFLAGLLIWASGFAQINLTLKSKVHFTQQSSQEKELKSFSEGGKIGFHDTSGNVVVPAKFDGVGDNFDELIRGKGYIAMENDSVVVEYGFSEGFIKIRLNQKWGYMHKSGNEVISPKYDFAENFFDGFAMVRINDKWGYIDTLGNEIIPPKYDVVARRFSNGLRIIGIKGDLGFIDTSGNEVISPKYDKVSKFSDGIAVVNIGNKTLYIDKQGNEYKTRQAVKKAVSKVTGK